MSPIKLVRIGTIFRLRKIGWERHKEYDEKSLKKLMAFQTLMILLNYDDDPAPTKP